MLGNVEQRDLTELTASWAISCSAARRAGYDLESLVTCSGCPHTAVQAAPGPGVVSVTEVISIGGPFAGARAQRTPVRHTNGTNLGYKLLICKKLWQTR